MTNNEMKINNMKLDLAEVNIRLPEVLKNIEKRLQKLEEEIQ